MAYVLDEAGMSKSEREDRALQRRRMRTGRLLLRGVAQAEVARRVAVTRTMVSPWNEQLNAGGLRGLKRRQVTVPLERRKRGRA
jgi:hypothetical protein